MYFWRGSYDFCVGFLADTPKATIDAWNVEDQMALVLVSSNKICGARFANGEVNFLVCAGPLD